MADFYANEDNMSGMQLDFYKLAVARTQRVVADLFELVDDPRVAHAIVSAVFAESARMFVVAAIAATRKDDSPANRAAAFRLAATKCAQAFEDGRL